MKNRIIAIVILLGILLSGSMYSKKAEAAFGENAFPRLMTLNYNSGEDNVFPSNPTRVQMTVLADGVRLRDWPSNSGNILELMYSGEKVYVVTLGSTWSHVRRNKTGTYGYCMTQYIG